MNTERFNKWLEGFINYERNITKGEDNIKKMKYFAKLFNNPQNEFKSIHVAGSKGKGSVSTMLSFILKEAGLHTGLYTSPHVLDFRERMSNAGSFFTDKAYEDAYKNIIEGFENIIARESTIDPGWFEIVTLTAFLLFKQQKIDWAVVETGMGGRFDMTNILKPNACVLTPIEIEHAKYLGNTIEKIAFEKAGIIKPKTPIFCCKQCEDAFNMFKTRANELNCDFFYMPDVIRKIEYICQSKEGLNICIYFNQNNSLGKTFARPLNIKLKLLDSIQAENASIAACTIKYLFPYINENIIEQGLSKAWLSARFEFLLKEPELIIDGAHTKNSIDLCMKTYAKLTTSSNKLKKGILIFACAEDKDAYNMASFFKGFFQKIIITIPGFSKKSNSENVFEAFKTILKSENNGAGDKDLILKKDDNFEKVIEDSIAEAIEYKIPLLITGSFYLAAEAKKIYNLNFSYHNFE